MNLSLPEDLNGSLVTLRRYRVSDASALKIAIESSFAELKAWMPWSQERPTDESSRAFVERSAVNFRGDAEEEGVGNYAITLAAGGRYVGSCGLMPRVGPGALEIGYWVDSRFTGRGIATEAARLLTTAAFGVSSIVRVEIRCDEANSRSAAVPRRLGYSLDRIEDKPVQSPGETGREMIWLIKKSEWDASLGTSHHQDAKREVEGREHPSD